MSKIRLLAISRDPKYQVEIGQILSRYLPGGECLAIRNALEAPVFAAAKRPDYILMDTRMPRAEWVETCRRLKAGKLTRDICLILAVDEQHARSMIPEVLSAGADDFILKPIDGAELVAKLRRVTRMRHGQTAAAHQAGAPDGPIVQPELTEAPAELLPEMVFEIDPAGNVTFANVNASRITGYTQEDLEQGLNVLDILAPECRGRAERDIGRISAGEGSGPLRYVAARKDGGRFPVTVHAQPTAGADGRRGLRAIAIDVGGLRESRKGLCRYRKQLQRLTSELATVEDRQRQRIAAALHDSVGQHLAASSQKLQLLKASGLAEGETRLVNEIIATIRQISREIGSLTFELCPPVLYEAGLVSAIAWLLRDFQARHGIICELQNDLGSIHLDVSISSCLFQAVRELLRNVARHAGARGAGVAFSRGPEGTITIVVEDDGVGFDASRLDPPQSEQAGGFGLLNTREQMRNLGGRMEVRSRIGVGTSVALILPRHAETTANAGAKP